MKIAAAFQVGPDIKNWLGFDLIFSKNSI